MADSTPVPAEPLHPLLLPQPDRGRVLMSDQTLGAAYEAEAHPDPVTWPYDGPTYTVGGPGWVQPAGWVSAEEMERMEGASDV